MGTKLIAIWRRLPVLVRAPIVAFVVLNVGSTLGVLPIVGNMKLLTSVPWALPATLVIMWAFWLYATGSGYPAVTRAYRATMTRDKTLSAPVWRAAMLAVAASLIATWSLRLVLPSMLPVAPPSLSIDISVYPVTTTIGLALALAVSAGIVEEIAFRGYLQKSLEDAYGIVPALILTGIAFWYAYADKMTASHLPFHPTVSVLLGTATYLTRSLLPAIIGHALGDALLIPAYVYHRPAVAWSMLTAKPVCTSSSVSPTAVRVVSLALPHSRRQRFSTRRKPDVHEFRLGSRAPVRRRHSDIGRHPAKNRHSTFRNASRKAVVPRRLSLVILFPDSRNKNPLGTELIPVWCIPVVTRSW
jgi:membrane protease YdiL (CAAX protease family)